MVNSRIARMQTGTGNRPSCARPMRMYFVTYCSILCTVSCSADEDVRCSGGAATMLTSDVLHGHARRLRRRIRIVTSSRLHLTPILKSGLKERKDSYPSAACTEPLRMHFPSQCYSGVRCNRAQLDERTMLSCIKATNHMRLSYSVQ